MKFFEFLQGKRRFSFEEYETSFDEFQRYIDSIDRSPPDFMRSPEEFLQFLYDQNVLCFIEQTKDESFIRWCFRERSANNVSPKVKLGMSYEIHYGLANTLNTGKHLTKKSIVRKKSAPKRTPKGDTKEKSLEGTIKFFDRSKGYGFIKQPNLPFDIYFREKKFQDGNVPKQNDSVFFELEKDPKKDGKFIARNIRKKL